MPFSSEACIGCGQHVLDAVVLQVQVRSAADGGLLGVRSVVYCRSCLNDVPQKILPSGLAT